MSTPQTILITGATAGIGKHAALHLAKRGHRVIATGRRPDPLAALAAEAETRGLALETVILDVTSQASIDAAAAEVDRLTGGRGLDVLVNNAGFGQFGPVEQLRRDDLQRQFDTNVFGLVATTQAFLPAMRERRSGRIINISSVGGRLTFPFGGAYHATKYAVEALSDALRRELLLFGVDVVVIEPGVIATEFGDRAMKEVGGYRDPRSPYARMMERADALKQRTDRVAADPLVISKAIAHAVESRHPRARYIAPRATHLLFRLTSGLPTRWLDRALLRLFGVRPQHAAAPASAGEQPAPRGTRAA